jgi:hypothetical protein
MMRLNNRSYNYTAALKKVSAAHGIPAGQVNPNDPNHRLVLAAFGSFWKAYAINFPLTGERRVKERDLFDFLGL